MDHYEVMLESELWIILMLRDQQTFAFYYPQEQVVLGLILQLLTPSSFLTVIGIPKMTFKHKQELIELGRKTRYEYMLMVSA